MLESKGCAMSRKQMVGVSDAAKTLSRQIDRVSEGEEVFILKNNAVKAVLVSIDEYERLCTLRDIAERYAIAGIVKERENEDPNKNITLEELAKKHGL